MARPAFVDHAAAALQPIYDVYGVDALWTPAGGGVGAPVRVIKLSPTSDVSLGPSRAQADTNTITVRVSEVAQVAKGARVQIGSDVYRILANPPDDDFGLEWVCEAAPVAA